MGRNEIKEHQQSNGVFFPMWTKSLNYINSLNDQIIEVGCGTGRFASLAMERGYNYQWGIDSHEERIKCAQLIHPRRFVLINSENTLDFLSCYDFDVLVFFNTLYNGGASDLELLTRIKRFNPTTRLIISFLSGNHLGDKQIDNFVDILNRYKGLLKLNVNKHSSIKLTEDIKCLIGEYRFINHYGGDN